jgi:hypothetical protein
MISRENSEDDSGANPGLDFGKIILNIKKCETTHRQIIEA